MKQFDRRLRSQEENTGQSRKRYVLPVLIAAGIVVILGVILFSRKKEKVYNSYEVLQTAELSMDSAVHYCAYDSGYISYGRDGAAAFDAQGKQQWNIAYVMKNPLVSVCGTYTVVADKGGLQFYIVDGNGTASRFELTDKISAVRIASQGVTAVMTTGEESDHIYLYEPGSASALVDIMTMTKSNGFPLALALSQDGRKLITSYVTVEDDSCISWVTFYNFGEVGQNYVDNMVGSYSFEALVPEINFVTNDIAVICRDDGIVFYHVTEIPKVMATEDFTEQIRSVFCSKGYTGLVLEAADGGESKLILYQNEKGKRVLNIEIPSDYTGIYTSGTDIVCYDSGELRIYSISGKQKFHTEFSKNINAVFRVDDSTKYILIGDQTAETIRLKKAE